MNKPKRIFIAVELPKEVLEALYEVQTGLKKSTLFEGRAEPKQNLHITIKFIGPVTEEMLKNICQKLNGFSFEPFSASLGNLEFIRGRNDRSYIWCSVPHEALLALAKSVDELLAEWILKGTKSAALHITLFRLKHVAHAEELRESLAKVNVGHLQVPISKLTLMQSFTEESGSRYIRLGTFQ